MRCFLSLFLLSGFAFIFSCEGPAGPVGPQGPEGAPGEILEAFVYEIEFDFEGPNYGVLFEFPATPEVLPSDVVLVYFLWDIDEGLDVWKPLPLTLFAEDGIVNYSFDFTQFDVLILLESNFDPVLYTELITDGWVARVVVIPGVLIPPGGRMDFSDYYEVEAAYGLTVLPQHGTATNRNL